MSLLKVNGRLVRPAQGPPLATYPPTLRRVFFWYDSLSDWQRVQYAGVTIMFLLACAGYLLGLGSAIVLARVESQQELLAAEALPTEPPTATSTTSVPVALPSAAPTGTAAPSPTVALRPSATPFEAPVIAEPPAVPRQLPAAPAVVAPAAPAAPRTTPTANRPRNLETSKPEAPSAIKLSPTPGVARPPVRATATVGRQSTPVSTSVVRVTPAPTVSARATARPPTPTTAPAHVATVTAVPTKAAQVQPTPTKTPAR